MSGEQRSGLRRYGALLAGYALVLVGVRMATRAARRSE